MSHRLRRLFERLSAFRTRARSPWISRLLLVCGLAVFGSGAVFAWRELNLADRAVSWPLLLVAGLVGSPASQTILALEYRQLGALVGAPQGLRKSFTVTVAASAANQLPLPGSFLVRSGSLRASGVGLRKASFASALPPVLFLAVSAGGAATWLAMSGSPSAAIPLGAVSFGALGVAIALLRLASADEWRGLLGLLCLELLLVSVAACRGWLVLQAFGISGSWFQVLGLSVSAAASTLVGVFPSGIGLTELLAGGVGDLLGLGAATGFLVAVVDRLFRMSFLALAATFLYTSRQRGYRYQDQVQNEADISSLKAGSEHA